MLKKAFSPFQDKPNILNIKALKQRRLSVGNRAYDL